MIEENRRARLEASKVGAGGGGDSKQEEKKKGLHMEEFYELRVGQMPQDITPLKMHDRLRLHPAFLDVEAIRLPPGPAGGQKSFSFDYGITNVGADKVTFQHMVEYHRRTRSDFIADCLKYVRNIRSTNGTRAGVTERLVTQLPKVEPFVSSLIADAVMAYMAPRMIWNFEEEVDEEQFVYHKIPERPDWEDKEVFDLTWTADAGFPYIMQKPNAKTQEFIEPAVEQAEVLIKMIEEDNDRLTATQEYFRKHPEQCTFLLKRKHERMPAENMTKKVRPYYVPPLPLKLLFLWVAHYIQKFLVSYQEDQDSLSAYKTSFFYGGCQRFVDWIKSVREEATKTGKHAFKGICFGDDNFWVFGYPNGDLVLMAPDVSAMDMHVANIIGPMVTTIFTSYYRQTHGEPPPKLFTRILTLLAHFAFKTPVHIAGSFRMLMLYGLRSGIPLTTVYDIAMSAAIMSMIDGPVRQALHAEGDKGKSFDPEIFARIMGVREHAIYAKLSCQFKPETMKPQVIPAGTPVEDVGVRVPFLGNTFAWKQRVLKLKSGDRDVSGWIPQPVDILKFAGSYIWPPRLLKGDAVEQNTMERIYGLSVSGAWTNDELYTVMAERYKELSARRIRPQAVDAVFVGLEDVEQFFKAFKDSEIVPLLTQDLCQAMYTQSQANIAEILAEVLDEKILEVDLPGPPKPVTRTGVPDVDLSEVIEMTGSMAVRVSAKHAGKANLPKPPPVQSGGAYRPPVQLKVNPKFKNKGRRMARIVVDDDEDDKHHDDDAVSVSSEASNPFDRPSESYYEEDIEYDLS